MLMLKWFCILGFVVRFFMIFLYIVVFGIWMWLLLKLIKVVVWVVIFLIIFKWLLIFIILLIWKGCWILSSMFEIKFLVIFWKVKFKIRFINLVLFIIVIVKLVSFVRCKNKYILNKMIMMLKNCCVIICNSLFLFIKLSGFIKIYDKGCVNK